MIGHTLILTCSIFALVAGSCFQVPSQQIISMPIAESSPCLSSGNVFENVFSPETVTAPSCSGQSVSSAPVEVFSTGSCSTPVLSNNVFSTGSSCATPVLSDSVFTTGSSCASPVVSTRNIYSSGSTPSLDNIFSSGLMSGSFGGQFSNEGSTSGVQVIQTPTVTLPAQEAPTVVLSSQAVPSPRVVAQRCICTKTIIRPQITQRTVVVPKIQRYIKRTVTPVYENVVYKSSPMSQRFSSSSSSPVVVSGSGSCGSSGYVSSSPVVVSGSSCSRC